MLRTRVSYASWQTDALKFAEKLSDTPANKTERAVIFAVHEIIDSIQKNGYSTVLAGIGISHLASWVAMYMLRSNRVNVQLLVELGLFGFLPPPGQPFLVSVRGLESCPMLTDTLGILGFVANNTRMLACMSAGQIDKYGDINSTKIGDLFLFGSGGANDASTTAKEVIVTLLHDKRRLVEQVPYITCTGQNVKKVVTDRAVFEKVENELVLKKIYVEERENTDEAISAVVQNMGWNPKISEELLKLEKPQSEEIVLLRCFDPERYFLGRL
jgi:acyl CoA:acetate/3-ketoacid CoA transferase beta subunit